MNKLIKIIAAVVILVVVVVLIFAKKPKNYRITAEGKEYVCTTRTKGEYKGTYLGFSKDVYNSADEAKEACKQKEVITHTESGNLEEYQDAITKCEYKDEDDSNYYLYPEAVYTYKDCVEIMN